MGYKCVSDYDSAWNQVKVGQNILNEKDFKSKNDAKNPFRLEAQEREYICLHEQYRINCKDHLVRVILEREGKIL